MDWPQLKDRPDSVCSGLLCVDGTHLGHNLPDRSGNRFCINLVSVAGDAVDESGR